MVTKLTVEQARRTWESAAPGWARWEDVLHTGLRNATESMIDMADVREGSRVLDLACGAGSQAFQVAERVGSQGSVVASDISGTMLRYVREKAEQLRIDNLETLECAAEELSAPAQQFDAAICRLGIMLFPDPASAARAVRSVLAPGGRFAALVFTSPAANPFMAESMSILLRCAEKEAPPSGCPGLFALGAPRALEGILADSGYGGIASTVIRPTLALNSADDALKMMQAAFGVYRAVVADLQEEQRNAAWAEVRDFLSQFETDSGWETELEVLIASGNS